MKTTPYRTARCFPLLAYLIIGAMTGWGMPVVGLQSTPTATLLPDAVVAIQGLNVRLGPDTNYRVITVVVENDPLIVVGRDATCQWLRVRTPKNVEGWVSRAYVELNLNCNTIAVTTTLTLLPIPTERGTFTIETVPTGSEKFVELVRPLEAELRGRQIFEWRANFPLDPGQLFELVLWKPGQEPIANGFSPVGAGTATQVNVNFESAIEDMIQLRAGATYNWGVLLVTLNPYHRIRYLGDGHKFRLERVAATTLEPADTPTSILIGTVPVTPSETPVLAATLVSGDTPSPTPDFLTPTIIPIPTATLEPGNPPTYTPIVVVTATLEPADTPTPTPLPTATDTPSIIPSAPPLDTPVPTDIPLDTGV